MFRQHVTPKPSDGNFTPSMGPESSFPQSQNPAALLYSVVVASSIHTLTQGRIKLFGAPRQWKNFRPLFQAVFLSGGGDITPHSESNTTPPSPMTEITSILFYTGCPRRNGQNVGRVFLMLNYTDITQNTPYPKLNGYRDNGQRSLKLWQLLLTYWLPNTY